MNTTTAIRRNELLARQDILLRTTIQPLPDLPGHDFLVLNQHPALLGEPLLPQAPAARLER